MNKKSLLQLLISLIFFSITFYVVYGFINFAEKGGDADLISKESGKKIDVPSLLKRSFKTEQIDIFEKETFKELKDNSVEISAVKKTEIGKDNPFVNEE